MRLIKMFLFILPSMLVSNVFGSVAAKGTVLVCYGRLNPDDIKGYTYVILESQYYNIYEIRKIKSQNTKVLAYISLGEVNANALHFGLLKNHTVGKNEIWDSHYLNLREPKTTQVLMDIIHSKIKMGYDGFFLDNVDNFTHFGPQPDQKKELLDLLKKIHTAYPQQTFLQNAGLELISETAPFVDAVIIESIATNYTFNDKTYKLRAETDYQNYVTKLKAIKKQYGLPIILIEYADTKQLYEEVQQRIAPLKFDYFIGKIDLQTIPDYTK